MSKYFKIRKEEDDYLEFELANVNISMANAIRRIVLSEIQMVAIDEQKIKIIENTCPLHNEFIAHRMSLIPIRQDLKNVDQLQCYVSQEKTMDKPIENGQLNIMEITTRNVQIYDRSENKWLDSNSVFDGVYLITKLNLNQKFLAHFTLSKGTAKDHARWQSVHSIAYRYKVQADKKPGQAYDTISLEEEKNWIQRSDSEDPQAFIFFMESLGKKEPKSIILESLEILKTKCTTFLDWIKREKSEFGWNQMLELEYEGEMHTLGNLISTIGLEQIGDQDFIGYRIVHPMLNKFILRMKLDGDKDKEEHIEKLQEIVGSIIDQINTLMDEWSRM